MSAPRIPLTPISSNLTDRVEISAYERGRIAGMKAGGASVATIARHYDHPYTTVYNTLLQDPYRNEGLSNLRTGRPKAYSPAQERMVLRHVRAWPKDTYNQVIAAYGLTCKKGVVKKILKEHGITNWKAKRRPFLTPKNAANRLAWCLAHRHMRVEEWGMVMWSDECSVERGRGKNDEWCFRTPAQKWHKEMVQTYNAKKNMKVMVWGCFWDYGRTNLYIMDRDFESAKHGYSAASYLEVLEAEIAPLYPTLDPGYEYMQDNASIHKAHKVRDWFAQRGITILLNWPAYSPDLNPIEHIWWHLKKRVVEMFPEIAAERSQSEEARARLESALQAAWDTLDKELFDALYKSMPRRIEACIEAKGWHTKY